MALNATQNINARLIIQALNKYGVTNPNIQAGILGTVYKESHIMPQSEGSYKGTSNSRIRGIFGSRLSGYSESQLETLKKNDVAFFDAIYGKDTNIGKNMGNLSAGDGYKYRGRGFNQITGKSAYVSFGNKIGVDLGKSPDKLNDPKVAAEALAVFFRDVINSGFKSGKFEKFGLKSIEDTTTTKKGTQVAIQSNAGLGTSFENSTVQEGYNKAMTVVDDFKKTFIGANDIITNPLLFFFAGKYKYYALGGTVLIVGGVITYVYLQKKKGK